ncbi:MAG: leucyl/phenylalanyl-tRNA--protein transferase [Verrucomicrobiales bacterium]|nr:leucyl/phenylalanyl-tRNA--protein transferase [Verrucomicrobiales bacterium]
MRLLTRQLWFPDPRTAQRGELDGLVAIGGDLSLERLLLAYKSGIFPWSADPITWWSPDPRAVFEHGSFRLSKSLAKFLRKNPFSITRDRAFKQVIEACAVTTPTRQETWISQEFVAAYTALHHAGHAHSVECWLGDDLVGGIYGVQVGALFAGESMFHRADNASKVALHHLLQHLESRGFQLFDTQVLNPTTEQLGASQIPREEYLKRLSRAIRQPCLF